MSEIEFRWTEKDRIGDLGGFASVYRAQKYVDDQPTGEIFALKQLLNIDNDSVERFQKEVRLLRNLDHPRVIKVIGFGLAKAPYFYAMPLFKGSLRSFISEYENDYLRIKNIVNEIFDGVEYMHQQGVIHRDIKPENILINTDTDIAISDLGLGLDTNSDSTRLTMTGQGMGTFWYWSPEQYMDAKHVDERTDIFGLGRTISELFGMPRGGFDTDILPQGIRHVIDKSTQNSKDRRYTSIDEFRTSFNLAMDVIIFGLSNNNNRSLLASIVASFTAGKIDNNEVKKFGESLVHSLDDQDLVHDMVMQLPPPVIKNLEQVDIDIARNIIRKFSDNVTSQSWGFDYTDKIGNQCYGLYLNSQDVEIRADLLFTIAEVGLSHNRWFVMSLASTLLHLVTDTTESLILLDKMKLLRVKNLDGLNPEKLNPVLQGLL